MPRKSWPQLRAERGKPARRSATRAQSIANTADSLLKTERVTQDRLNQQLSQAEAEIISLKGDLGFFERLLPAAGATGWQCVRCKPSRCSRASCAFSCW